MKNDRRLSKQMAKRRNAENAHTNGNDPQDALPQMFQQLFFHSFTNFGKYFNKQERSNPESILRFL